MNGSQDATPTGGAAAAETATATEKRKPPVMKANCRCLPSDILNGGCEIEKSTNAEP